MPSGNQRRFRITKACVGCGEVMESVWPCRRFCDVCRKKRRDAYYQHPEVKAQRQKNAREYQQRSEVKERIKAYHKTCGQRPEIKERERAYARAYHQSHRDEHLAKMRAYNQTHYDIWKARKQFEELAEVNPNEAEKILSQIEGEEGPAFRELLLDGIPERVLNVKSGGD